MNNIMTLLRIREATPSADPNADFTLALVLTDGSEVQRDVTFLLNGPVFDAIKANRGLFIQVRAEDGTVLWPNGADLDPDVLIWGGPPPEDASATPPKHLTPRLPARTA
ncbi:MAG: DUF2442 domain-containing protein [Dehalococcoidia bacterium]